MTYCGFVDQNWQYDIVRKHTRIDIFKYWIFNIKLQNCISTWLFKFQFNDFEDVCIRLSMLDRNGHTNSWIYFCTVFLTLKATWFKVLLENLKKIAHIETSPLPMKAIKIQTYARHLQPKGREGSLSFHSCSDTGPRFLESHMHPKDCPNFLVLYNKQQLLKTYSTPIAI